MSERLSQQHVMNHFETHQKFIEEKYSALARANCEIFWEHILSVYTELVSTVAEDVKKDSKVHLTLRWMNTTTSYLDGSSQNSKVCTPVFTDLSSKHSSATIRAVIGVLYSKGHNSGLFSRPL